jgi:hypothetical protein
VSGVYVGDIGATIPTKVVYTSNITSADYAISGNASSSAQIVSYPIAPSQSGFPLSTVGLEFYTIQPYASSTPLGAKIRYNVDCLQKYPNVRIKWKNRFGQFDYFNFYMVNKQSFQTTKRTYQPQIGTWEGTTFAYNDYDSSNLNYINDSKQSISVNTFWIPEDYNEIFKQLLVSDEIYWLYDESNNKLRPLTIATSNILFKTGVVDKQIQYSFTFNFGQPYKLIM